MIKHYFQHICKFKNHYRDDKLDDVIQELYDSEFDFYLHGSRNKATLYDSVNISEKTDYDFTVSHSQFVHSFLEKLGFKIDGPHLGDYKDSLCVDIYKYKTDDEFLNLQIVTKIDADFYMKCFDSIKEKEFHEKYWKSCNNFLTDIDGYLSKKQIDIRKEYEKLYEENGLSNIAKHSSFKMLRIISFY